jgi:hypothetical protein
VDIPLAAADIVPEEGIAPGVDIAQEEGTALVEGTVLVEVDIGLGEGIGREQGIVPVAEGSQQVEAGIVLGDIAEGRDSQGADSSFYQMLGVKPSRLSQTPLLCFRLFIPFPILRQSCNSAISSNFVFYFILSLPVITALN